MANKTTRKALLFSSLSLLLCFAMLLGTTFAWFTDSVTSAGNIIKAGNLDVAMHWADGKEAPADTATVWTDASTGAIFNHDKWEPGFVDVKHIKISNVGNLAFKYQITIDANGEVSALSDVIDVYYADPAVQATDRALTGTSKIGTLTEVLAGMATTAYGELPAGENHTITLALKMQESAGNEYQSLSIGTDFSVILSATQLDAEEDSFGKDYDKNALVKGRKITGGTYSENPALYDETLAEPNSEYIAVEFEKDGQQQWVVNKRSETVVVSAGPVVASTARNYEIKENSSGSLWKIISGLQNNEHSTVYLLPGTYNEATTINVYSSMDIIGLGDAEDIKVVKVKGSNSNKHLFNCNGTKSDYIHVTIRNMHLDSSVFNLNSKGKYTQDNAAVQSIRRTKVKCYDLIVTKGTGNKAFYVNAQQTGYKDVPAYMYVENCTVDKNANGVVDQSNSGAAPYFYYNGITLKDGTLYNKTSTYIKNQSMDANNWW